MNHSTLPPFMLLRQRMSDLRSPLKSPVPTICQSRGRLPTPCETMVVAASISCTTTPPLMVSRQRMSHLPSPLKSPVPATTQLRGKLPTPCEDMMVAPFMNEITIPPLVVSRQRMSPLPVPSKSPVPTIAQLEGKLVTPSRDLIPVPVPVPVISHIATPPLVLRKRMSAKPSASKSRCPTMDQSVGRSPTPSEERTVPSFVISDMATPPLILLRQRMSLTPSLLKSWAAVTVAVLIVAENALRPCVAATSTPVLWLKTRSTTGVLGSPALKGVHDAPPSWVRKTPRSVPIRISMVGAVGSSTIALTGMLGRLLVMSFHMIPPFVVLNTWPTFWVSAKPETVTKAFIALV